jgi:hypothetical protein
MKVKRFARVSRPHGPVVHRYYGNRFVEGDLTACGIPMRAGWAFWIGNQGHPKWGDLLGRPCKRCELSKGDGK